MVTTGSLILPVCLFAFKPAAVMRLDVLYSRIFLLLSQATKQYAMKKRLLPGDGNV